MPYLGLPVGGDRFGIEDLVGMGTLLQSKVQLIDFEDLIARKIEGHVPTG